MSRRHVLTEPQLEAAVIAAPGATIIERMVAAALLLADRHVAAKLKPSRASRGPSRGDTIERAGIYAKRTKSEHHAARASGEARNGRNAADLGVCSACQR
jgi:hypothetical protein